MDEWWENSSFFYQSAMHYGNTWSQIHICYKILLPTSLTHNLLKRWYQLEVLQSKIIKKIILKTDMSPTDMSPTATDMLSAVTEMSPTATDMSPIATDM